MPLRHPTAGPGHGLNAHPSLNIPEAATQTFKRGSVIAANTAGFAQEAATDPVDIVGIAENPGTNLATAGTPSGAYDGYCRVAPALPHSMFEFSLDSTSLTPYALLATDMVGSYGLTKDGATGIWYVDIDKTGGGSRVVVTGFRDPIGTAQARVYVTFRQSTTIFQ